MSNTNNAKQGTQGGRPDRLMPWVAAVVLAVVYLGVLPMIAAGN